MICQRCLQPVLIDLAVERDFRFVTSEKEAVQQDLETEEDLLVLTPSFDLLALIEDELLLAMPIIASHQICEAPLTPALAETQEGVDASHPTSSETVLDAQQHPFAVLAALKAQKD